MIRVLLADDQALVRGALAALLRLESDIAVVAEVARGDEVVSVALATQPDVALIDIEMPGANGLDAARALREYLPSCKIVIVTTFGRSGYLQRAMASGNVRYRSSEPTPMPKTHWERSDNGHRTLPKSPPARQFGVPRSQQVLLRRKPRLAHPAAHHRVAIERGL